jgi:ech hydrogenase subunit C
VGACACTGGIFARAYNIIGGVDKVVPVDAFVPGCAAHPESIMDGVLRGVEILQRKHQQRLDDEAAEGST